MNILSDEKITSMLSSSHLFFISKSAGNPAHYFIHESVKFKQINIKIIDIYYLIFIINQRYLFINNPSNPFENG